MQAEVLARLGERAAGRWVLAAGERLLVGAGPEAEARLADDPLVSPRHLGLELRADGLWATDLSATGSALGGRPLPPGQPVPVPPGAVLQVGRHELLARPLAAAPSGSEPTGIRSDYENLGELGKGAAGIVFHARHRASGREVALKMLHEQVDPTERERFLREAEVCRRIQSPHVVAVFEARVEGPVAFSVMELVRGASLRDHLQRAGGGLPIEGALRVGLGVAKGLAAAHAVGVIHRDVKPANVLITGEGVVKVVDFGLAKDTQSVEALTKTRQGMGTLAYVAPEQAHDSKRVDARADLYGLGAVLYHVVAGRPPFTAPGMEILHQIYDEEPEPLEALRPDCPAALAELVAWLLQKDPDDRPPTAALVIEELEAITA